jgi:hypothetical protein
MKKINCSLTVVSIVLLLSNSTWGDFLPVANGEQFGLEYGEAIAGMPPGPPEIDGKLDDWRYAVWIAFDSKEELYRGQGAWKDEDDLSFIWSVMYDEENFYFAAAVRDDIFAPSADVAQAWLGDCIFLYIDWANNKVEVSSKPNFALINDKSPTAAGRIRRSFSRRSLSSPAKNWGKVA